MMCVAHGSNAFVGIHIMRRSTPERETNSGLADSLNYFHSNAGICFLKNPQLTHSPFSPSALETSFSHVPAP